MSAPSILFSEVAGLVEALVQGTAVVAGVLTASVLMCGALPAQLQAQDGLPLVESVPDRAVGCAMAILVTGDGDWSGADERIADSLSSHGIPTVGLKARSYLRAATRSPESFAADLERLARRYVELWEREEIVFVGYSRGASLGPFALARWPPDLRARLKLVVLLGPDAQVGFRFHWSDIVRDVRREGDLPVLEEIEKLRGLDILCVYGEDERESICRSPPGELFVPSARPGGHRIGRSAAPAGMIVAELIRLGLVQTAETPLAVCGELEGA